MTRFRYGASIAMALALTGCSLVGGDDGSTGDPDDEVSTDDEDPGPDSELPDDDPSDGWAALGCQSRSGTRLKVQKIEGEGLQQAVGIWDSELEVRCSGSPLCYPEFGHLPVLPLFFLEGDCTTGPLVHISSDTDPGTYGVSPANYAAAAVGQEIFAPTSPGSTKLFRINEQHCEEISYWAEEGMDFRHVTRLFTPEDLAPTEAGRQDRGRLAVHTTTSVDGLVFCHRKESDDGFPVYFDREREEGCEVIPHADGDWMCLPELAPVLPIADLTVSESPECEGCQYSFAPADCDPGCLTCGSPTLQAISEGGEFGTERTTCSLRDLLHVRVHRLGGEWTAAANSGAVIENQCYGLGDPGEELPFSPVVEENVMDVFASLIRESVDGGQRLSQVVWRDSAGIATDAGWYDTDLNIPCAVAQVSDGSWRCLPSSKPNSRRMYSDATCTSPAGMAVVIDECQPEIPPYFVSDGVYEIRATAADTTYYSLVYGQGCTAFDTGVHLIDGPAELSQFAEVSLSLHGP